MIQVEEKKLAELIRKADKFEWLNQLNVEDMFDEEGISIIDNTNGAYYKYDNMSDKEVIEDYLYNMEQVKEKRLAELLRKEWKLGALEAGGVANWNWYGKSLYPDEDTTLNDIEDMSDEDIIKNYL